MEKQENTPQAKLIFVVQVMSMLLIWVFVLGIAVWIINLILLSIDLNDMPGASVAISVIAIPVFFTLASVLTYVFIGLQKENNRFSNTSKEE